jgi:hypothetical protein
VPAEPPFGFLGKFDQHGFDPDLDRVPVRVEIASAMEVMLVDDGPAEQPLRAEHKIERFAHRRFADVVAADQQRVACEVDHAVGNASEI